MFRQRCDPHAMYRLYHTTSTQLAKPWFELDKFPGSQCHGKVPFNVVCDHVQHWHCPIRLFHTPECPPQYCKVPEYAMWHCRAFNYAVGRHFVVDIESDARSFVRLGAASSSCLVIEFAEAAGSYCLSAGQLPTVLLVVWYGDSDQRAFAVHWPSHRA